MEKSALEKALNWRLEKQANLEKIWDSLTEDQKAAILGGGIGAAGGGLYGALTGGEHKLKKGLIGAGVGGVVGAGAGYFGNQLVNKINPGTTTKATITRTPQWIKDLSEERAKIPFEKTLPPDAGNIVDPVTGSTVISQGSTSGTGYTSPQIQDTAKMDTLMEQLKQIKEKELRDHPLPRHEQLRQMYPGTILDYSRR